jgi:membrane-bound lytic murein transglycosylase MltF
MMEQRAVVLSAAARRLRQSRVAAAVLLLCACLTACSDEGSAQQVPRENSAAANATPAEADPRAAEDAPEVAPLADEGEPVALHERINARLGDLDSMAEHRVIRILTVYSIGRYFLDGAEERGLVKESATLFEEFINQYLKTGKQRVYVAVIPVARDQLVPALLAGRGDIIHAGLTITPERQSEFDFSIPISKPLSEILVTGPGAPALATLDDLAGQTVYLRHSSSYRESVERLNERLISAGKEPVRIQAVSELLEDSDLVEMVNAGMLPWAVVDQHKLLWWEDVFKNITAREDIVLNQGGRTAWGIRRDSPLLMEAINTFLKTHREGTLFGNMMRNRYFRDFDWAANALGEDAHARFVTLEPLFRGYGDRYAVDHLLVAAQGFQESRLDQSVRSAAGAVGVMQIKPSTAQDPNIGIPDVLEVESNIHAGTKYLNFLRERYFNDPNLDELNSTLMALAAYNMGPARMIKLRSQAKQLGYDPNIWFDNVEIAAAKYVGKEPVTYVSNIYKYYIAYTLSEELVQARQAARARAGID